jgi:hypothetical protein
MVVLRDPGEAYLLRHTAGEDAVSWVEQIDPITLEPVARSRDLAGGRTWPGGLAAHADGSLHVVFGRHAHRLSPGLEVEASHELPRDRPYNSFVTLPDGTLLTKDFAGALPAAAGGHEGSGQASQLVALDPVTLEERARLDLPEASIARLSADGDVAYVVGDTSLMRVVWAGGRLALDEGFRARYRSLPGQTHGWDAVLSGGAAWFLDDGAGAEGYIGTFRGQGTSTAPLHLVRVDLATAAVTMAEVCGRPGGIVANPPAVDVERGVAVGYDSGNGVVAGFTIGADGSLTPRWRRDQDHGCHPLRYAGSGQLVTADHDAPRGVEAIVVLDIETGQEVGRVDGGSPVQSVLFPCPGFGRDLYLCSFTHLTRVWVDEG